MKNVCMGSEMSDGLGGRGVGVSVACGSTRHHESRTSKEQPGTSEFIAMFWVCVSVSACATCA